MNDSSVFDKDLYISLLKKIFGTRTSRKVSYKEVIINDISENEAISRLSSLRERASAYVQRHTSAQSYITYWMRGYDTSELKEISSQLEADVAYMADCRNPMAVNKLIDYPVLRILWAYHPARRKWLSRTLATFFPVGIPVWLWGFIRKGAQTRPAAHSLRKRLNHQHPHRAKHNKYHKCLITRC